MAEEEKKPEVEADLAERVSGFNKELAALLGKYELGIGAQAGLTPDGRVWSQPLIVSVRGKPNATVGADGKPAATVQKLAEA